MLRYGYSHMHKELQADLHNINAKGFFLFNRKYKKSDFIGVIIVATFWFKVATMTFFYFAMKRKAWKFFYYYKNVGVSVRWLWRMTLSFDFLTYVAVLFIGYYLR